MLSRDSGYNSAIRSPQIPSGSSMDVDNAVFLRLVDLEHRLYQSYERLTCFMQISKRTGDFVVDTLKLCIYIGVHLRKRLHDPSKEKIGISCGFIGILAYTYAVYSTLNSQEEFYKEQLKVIHEVRRKRGEIFENIQQEKRKMMKICMENPSSVKDCEFRFEQGATFILSPQKSYGLFLLMKGTDLLKILNIGRYRVR